MDGKCRVTSGGTSIECLESSIQKADWVGVGCVSRLQEKGWRLGNDDEGKRILVKREDNRVVYCESSSPIYI